MAKTGVIEEYTYILDTLSADLSSGLRIENESNMSEETCRNNEADSGPAVANISRFEPGQTDEEPPYYYDHADDGKMYEIIEHFGEYPQQVKAASSHIKTAKQKPPRIRQKDYNIISKRNNAPKLPSHFKFDKTTTSILEMILEYRHVGVYHNIIGKGLTSVVIHAHCYGKYHTYFPHGNAVKVYKLSSDVERNNAIYKRVQRENDHLVILRNQHFGNNFPHPVCYFNNVIVMSFIGADKESAPSISSITSVDCKKMYQSVIKEIEAWYKRLNLVHGNLSAKTVVFYQDIPHFIGWSHSVPKDHPKALIKLIKDCHFVTKFFEKRDVPVKSTEELFNKFTGIEKLSKKLLDMVDGMNLWQNEQPNPNIGKKSSSLSGQSRFK